MISPFASAAATCHHLRLVTLAENKTVQIGIAGSVAVHLFILLPLLAWIFAMNASMRWSRHSRVEEEREMTLLFPEQAAELLKPAVPQPSPPPAKPAPKPFIRSSQNQAAPSPPQKTDFVSDRNTVAASEKAPAPDGTKPLPTMDGIERQTNELANRQFQDGKTPGETKPPPPMIPQPQPQMRPPEPERPKPQPLIAKAEAAPPSRKMMEELEKDLAKAEPERLPLELKKAAPRDDPPEPQPAVKAIPAEPATAMPVAAKASDVFTPETHTSKVKGTISNRGEAAVNASETPMGRYMSIITSAVEKKWHLYRRRKLDAAAPGELSLRFFVNKAGRAEDLQITSDRSKADPRMTDFTLQAIMDAEIPPIPADLLPMLEKERVEIEYNVLIY